MEKLYPGEKGLLGYNRSVLILGTVKVKNTEIINRQCYLVAEAYSILGRKNDYGATLQDGLEVMKQNKDIIDIFQ
jgi:hypothetical protein